jgi:DNA ligase-1
LTTALDVATETALEATFEQAVADGSEGLVCKSIGPNAIYQAGARGWLWIKLKRDYRTELADTVDLVVVGTYAGRGRRRGTYGAVLLAAYDPETELYQTVGKCGTGFSDAELAALPGRLAGHIRTERPPESTLAFAPMCGSRLGSTQGGRRAIHAVPSVYRRWRDDKEPQDATTTQQLVELYHTARRAPAD